ncbi:MAG: alkaline phosphatase D family protein [Solirubrobacteraceae bacterium]
MAETSAHHDAALTRRRLLAVGAGASALALTPRAPAWAVKSRLPDDLFKLGVASGDPLSDSVVLWTRLAPDPLNGGGMPDRGVPVDWEISADEGFTKVVRRGTAHADPQLGHSVHVEVDGLRSHAWYWYRFRAGNEISRVARTRTAPAPQDGVDRLRFAFVSCQNYPTGFYAAYHHMAQEDLDLVIHLGDYIYEGAPGSSGVRRHEGTGEPLTLADYRNRHAQYRSDPDLQDAHAAFPFSVTWDDHEIDNNWADHIPQDPDRQTPQDFRRRRMAAIRAYYEHMPLRRRSAGTGASLPLYRRFSYGTLATFNVLDGRQYRSDQSCGDPFIKLNSDCAERYDAANTMLGSKQERWLLGGLARSDARWNILANQTIVAQYDYDPSAARGFNTDQWDGYPVERRRLLDLFARGDVSNPVVITGDWHSSWVNELKQDFDDPSARSVATEFSGTSISSSCGWARDVEKALGVNPHVRYFDGDRRGYVRCEVTREQWRSDFRLLPASSAPGVTVPSRDVPLEKTVSWVIPSGESVQPA